MDCWSCLCNQMHFSSPLFFYFSSERSSYSQSRLVYTRHARFIFTVFVTRVVRFPNFLKCVGEPDLGQPGSIIHSSQLDSSEPCKAFARNPTKMLQKLKKCYILYAGKCWICWLSQPFAERSFVSLKVNATNRPSSKSSWAWKEDNLCMESSLWIKSAL